MTLPAHAQRLEDAITLVARHMAARDLTLTRTKLVKLLYFVDLEAWQELGHPITGVEWEWSHYGPYSSTIVETCDQMERSGEIEVRETRNYYGSTQYNIYSSEPMYWSTPSKDLEHIVRRVVSELGPSAPTRIGDHSYDTPPMRQLIESGGKRGDLIEFPDPPAPRAEAVERTIFRYRSLARESEGEDRGSIADGLRRDAEGLDEARRSAGSKVLGPT